MNDRTPIEYTVSHWGTFEIDRTNAAQPTLKAWRGDTDPSQIGLDQLTPQVESMRIKRPAIRESWLRDGPSIHSYSRGRDRFVEVSWDHAIELLGGELQRVIDIHGNTAIYGGSYGWASAGRFHHAQSQIHRFLNTIGGYVASCDSYSNGNANVIMPHVVGSMNELLKNHTDWDTLAEHTDLFVAFGGVPLKNTQMTAGGPGRHRVRSALAKMAQNGAKFVNVSPQRQDFVTDLGAEWIPIRPNTDTALMLAIAHVIVSENRHDIKFLTSHCEGFRTVEAYLNGQSDGQPKTPKWAETITGVKAERIQALALEMTERRTMLNASWSLQRQRHGEQPYWAVVTLASILGQIGLPGGGFGVGYGTMNSIGSGARQIAGPTLGQGRNPVSDFIPVARISDMLLNPGGQYRYNGENRIYPDIRLIMWAGGNPFHHHQDLNRLMRAWQRPETIVIQDQFWTASAKAADIVLPATTTLERDDIGYASGEGQIVAMHKLQASFGEARSDFEIFTDLAVKMGVGPDFTENLDAAGWLRRMYENWRKRYDNLFDLPDFDQFWQQGMVEFPVATEPTILLEHYRKSPLESPLETPSGRIELFSQTIASFDEADCPGHAVWLEPEEWLGSDAAARYPLHLLSNQPMRRLHSQLDHGPYSRAGKIDGCEAVGINREDAADRGISDGDIVRISNERGSCLAGAMVSTDIRRGVLAMATGATFDPAQWTGDKPLEKHGNPNVLTSDRAASGLSQGCAAQSCLVDIEVFRETAPPVTATCPPEIVTWRQNGLPNS